MNAIFALANNVIRELYRRKDFYVLLVLTVLITLLMASASFLKRDDIVRGLQALCLMLIWISTLVMAVGTTARQIPAEREQKTIFPLLAKPVSRAQVITGKFLGCWLACGIALVVFYVFFGLISASREHELHLAIWLQAMWLQWIFLAIVVAVVLFGSIIFAAPSSNATICLIFILGIHFVGLYLGRLAMQQSEPARSIMYVIYFTVPQFKLFDIREMVVQHQGVISWLDIFLDTLYGLAYAALFLFAGWLCFRRKALNT